MSGGNILVVDDNEDVRRLVRKVLEASGYSVVEAASGEEAIRRSGSERPDLVLMDMCMPGTIDGLEATRRLKGDPRLREVPVVALTAASLERDRSLAMAAGCCGFIGKPIDILDLADTVGRYLSAGEGN